MVFSPVNPSSDATLKSLFLFDFCKQQRVYMYLRRKWNFSSIKQSLFPLPPWLKNEQHTNCVVKMKQSFFPTQSVLILDSIDAHRCSSDHTNESLFRSFVLLNWRSWMLIDACQMQPANLHSFLTFLIWFIFSFQVKLEKFRKGLWPRPKLA